MKMNRLLLSCTLAVMTAGCQNTSPSRSSSGPNPHGLVSQGGAGLNRDALDKRAPVPLLPRMAAHQRENMRDHLAAVQEIVAALSTGDFATVEKSAARIGYSEAMGQMCAHMGAGAPGFNELALNFHHTADTITPAAKSRDRGATLKAVAATLQTCVGCHAVYRQQIVDEETWKAITTRTSSTSTRP